MTLDYDDLLNSILSSMDRIKQVDVNDIPNIDLYMDQLLTFMDDSLKKSSRHPGEDKILTKTMINNYAKNDLIPPPIKKKYSRDHLILLIFIYYYKNILSISDIKTLLDPLSERFGNPDEEISPKDIYKTIYDEQGEIIKGLKDDIKRKYETAMKSFADAPDEEKLELQMFNFISMLSYDIFMKKLLVENILDHVSQVKAQCDEQEKKDNKRRKSKDK